MKIIKPGKWETNFDYEVVCSCCKTTLLVETKDIFYTPAGGGNYNAYDESYYFWCMVCKNSMYLEKAVIPEYVRKQAQQKPRE